MDFDQKLILLAAGSILGAGLTFLAQAYFNRLNFRQATISSVIKKYLDSRDELCQIISECVVNTDAHNNKWLKKSRDLLSIQYYKSFDYIPNEIISEIICLQACLKDKANRMYCVKDGNLCLVDESNLEEILLKISTLKNIAPALWFNLCNGTEIELRNRRIEYQARLVLMNINVHFTEKNLTSLSLFKPKLSVWKA